MTETARGVAALVVLVLVVLCAAALSLVAIPVLLFLLAIHELRRRYHEWQTCRRLRAMPAPALAFRAHQLRFQRPYGRRKIHQMGVHIEAATDEKIGEILVGLSR